MTDIEQKALALLNECAGQEVYGGWKTFDPNQSPCTRALCRAIEQHEAFAQEVSDAVEQWSAGHGDDEQVYKNLTRFIIAKPDPLVGVMKYLDWSDKYADPIRAALDALGFEIRKKNDD